MTVLTQVLVNLVACIYMVKFLSCEKDRVFSYRAAVLFLLLSIGVESMAIYRSIREIKKSSGG